MSVTCQHCGQDGCEADCPEAFASKVDWEGGIGEMMSYGGAAYIDKFRFSEELKQAWRDFCAAQEKLEEMLSAEGGVI